MHSRTLHITLMALACWAFLTDFANGVNSRPSATQVPAKIVESTFISPGQWNEHVHSSSVVELPTAHC